MRYECFAILAFTLSTQVAFAQTLDKAKFRQAIELPAISTHFNVEFKANERDGRGNKYDPLRKIQELQTKLTGGVDDAEVYLEQRAVFLECVKENDAAKKAKDLFDKAEAALRPVVQSNDPKHGILLTTYGAILETANESPWNDCEKLARRAVTLAPNDWRAWAYLAHVRHQQFPALVCGGSDKNLPRQGRTQEILGMLYLQRGRAEHVAEAEKALNEALQYHDKARDLAPNDPKRQIQRYGFRLTEVVLRNAIAGYRGQKPPYQLQQLERPVLDELESAARLNSDHLLWQSQLVHQLVLLGWQQKDEAKKGELEPQPIKKFRPARPEDAQAIKDALARIEKIADASTGETAVFCHSMLAALYSSMQDNATVEKHARKVLQLDPKNQMAAEQLQQALFLQDRFADQRATAQKQVELSPSPRNCYLLAKALGFNQRYDLAEQAILTGLKLDPNDAYCLMGRAALLMRGGDDAASVASARDYLERARRYYRSEDGALGFAELECLTAAHYALSGDVALAHVKLQHLRSQNPDNVRYGKLLSAFSRK